jgi:hypothetical protein
VGSVSTWRRGSRRLRWWGRGDDDVDRWARRVAHGIAAVVEGEAHSVGEG